MILGNWIFLKYVFHNTSLYKSWMSYTVFWIIILAKTNHQARGMRRKWVERGTCIFSHIMSLNCIFFHINSMMHRNAQHILRLKIKQDRRQNYVAFFYYICTCTFCLAMIWISDTFPDTFLSESRKSCGFFIACIYRRINLEGKQSEIIFSKNLSKKCPNLSEFVRNNCIVSMNTAHPHTHTYIFWMEDYFYSWKELRYIFQQEYLAIYRYTLYYTLMMIV